MVNETIKVSLLFDANVAAAQQNVQSLFSLLNQISTKTHLNVESGTINQAVNAAQQLQLHLSNAVNVDTGKINLNKLQSELKSAGTNLQQLSNQLRMAGPTGEQAFLKIANAVAQAEVPMVKMNGMVKNLLTTLGNTAKWQISSMAIHGIINAFHEATDHAKDFNKALTDIQIVTGYSTAKMSKLAESATKAAKELNTTSTEYAKAALIFYQQGLDGEAVEERANAVVKLSQVTGESAKIVSDQMTAIWNNFDDGSQSLEYYADILTKLGAATAASTDEISAGLEKFAATADTIGLSYEYAASAVATVVAETRQSAEVVGTSFKTIFSRMQGLSLGETLEDGVDLNKYTEALESVGIDVLTASGEMREMDSILDELGEKWEGFGETTQIALAQTVGGVRQYNQMIALMDNWDEVKENIALTGEAVGELDKQFTIWSDSYEASMEKMTQAKNELFEQFVDSDFLIGWNDSLTLLIKSVSSFIDKIGGLGPLLLSLTGIFSKTLFPLMMSGLKSIYNFIQINSGNAAKSVAAMQQQMSASMSLMMNKTDLTNGMKEQLLLSQRLMQEKEKLMITTKHMTEAQRLEAQGRLAVCEALVAETSKVLEEKSALEKEIVTQKESIATTSERWGIARKAAETEFQEQSDAEAMPNETEEQKKQRQITNAAIIDDVNNRTYAQISEDATTAKEIVERQKKIDEQQPEIDRLKQKQSKHEALTDEENSTWGKFSHLQKSQEESKKYRKEKGYSEDVDEEYVTKMEKTKNLAEKVQTNVREDVSSLKVGKATSSVKEGAMYEYSEDFQKMGANRFQQIAANETNMTFDSETQSVTMDASIANYEKLYEVLGRQKTLQSELATALQEFNNVQNQATTESTELAVALQQEEDAKRELANSGKALNQAQKDEANAAKGSKLAYAKLSKEQKTYLKAQDKVEKSTKNVAKAQENCNKAQININKNFGKSKTTYKQLAQNAGATEEQLKELDIAFDNLAAGAGNPEDEFRKISSVFKDLGIAADGVSIDIVEMANKMRQMLIDADISDDKIDILTQAFQKLANLQPAVTNGLNSSKGALDNLNTKVPTVSQSLGSMATNAMTLVGNMMSLKSGVEGIASAFTEGGTASEKFQAILGGLLGILPTIIMLTNASKAAQDMKNAQTGATVAANTAQTVSETTKTASVWANTTANIANLLSNPWTMALAAVAMIAIGIVCASLDAKTEATEANTQANIDNAQASNDLCSKWAEEQDAMDDLIAKYKDLKNAGQDYLEVVEDIKDATPDLIEAYKEAAEGTGINTEKGSQFSELIDQLDNASAAGDVEGIENAQQALDNLISPEAAKSAQQGYDSAVKKLALAMEDTYGSLSDDKYTVEFQDWGDEGTNGEEIITKHFGENSETYDGFIVGDHRASIALDYSSTESFMADYEKLLAVKEEMEDTMSAKDLEESGYYEEINELITNSEEAYNTVKEMQEEASKFGIYDAKANLEANGMNITEINSLEEYKEYKDALLNDKNIKGDPDAEAAALQWLEANEAIKEYSETEKIIANVGDRLGDNAEQDVQSYYDSLENSEEQELFLKIVPSLESTDIDSLNEAMQEAYDKAGAEDISQYDIDTTEYEEYLDLLKNEFPNAYEDNAKGANEVAKANLRLDKGVESLSEKWEDYNEAMTSGSLTDISKVLPDIKKGIQNILNLDTEQFELLPDDFAEKNWELIDDVVHGVEGSVDKLRDVAGQEILLNIEGAVDSEGNIKNDLLELHNSLASWDDMEFEVGVAIDNTKFIDACNEMIATAGMTADEAKSYFASMGYDVELQEVEPKATTTTWKQDGEYFDFATGETKKISTKGTSTQFSPPAYAIKTITPNGSYGGGIGVNTTASPSTVVEEDDSGSSEDNTPEVVKKSDTVERYKEINDQLEDISRNLDKINDKMDDAYGQARLDAMDEYIANLEKENKALETKGKEIERNISEDQQTVADAAAGVGMSVEFDENGNITNATQIEEAWYARLASATTKDEQDEIQGYIDVWEDAQGDYEDSLNEFWDNEDAKRENRRKQQEKEFEKWNYKIELDVELDEGELALIDYYQDKLSDDIYGMAESAALTGQEIDITLGNLANREKQYAELTQLYESGKISQAQYAEGLKELQEAELEDLETLRERKKELEEYYRNTLSMASEEIDKYTARLERSTSILEHYQTMLELTGQGQNYEAMGKVLEGQQKTIENQYAASKKEYEMYKKQADEKYAAMQAARGTDNYEKLKEDWEAAVELANDAQDRMNSNAQKKAEIAISIFENSLNQMNQRMESVLTNGRSFDEINMKMEHQQSLQEEYLTTTNKIYETTKMMRNLQNEIDKTTNRVAKQKLKAFQQETKQLQEQGKLSKFELDIQQAKYDLLLAEIALEEAQNAKSTVRLQRDSEGNFGYVYTADQEEVSGAEQAVDDAENALYNVQLEGANNYAQQSFQLQQEGLDALKELNDSYRSGDIQSEEEYQRRREEIINYYTQRLTDVSNLYGIAVSEDSRVAADAWSTNITDLVADADTWKSETTKYSSEVDQAFRTLNAELAKIAEEMGVNLDDIGDNINDVTKESDKWSKELQKDVIPDLEDTIDEVDDLANELLKDLIPEIKDATKKGELLAKEMYEVQRKLSGLAGEAEKSASRAANVAGQWRSYWDAVNNSDGGGDTADDYAPGPDDGGGTVLSVYGFSYKTENGTKLIKFEDGTYGYDSSFIEKNTNNFTAVPTKGANTYSGTQVGFDSSSGETIIKLGKKRASYDTGGYTGEWGSEGKLATLHEKELVLNKEDTKNFLASLELLHNIIKMIDMNTSNSLINRLDSANLKTNKSNDILEQHVTIEAVFPNVEDRYEIEEAFMNLTNEASQYINRKNN